MPAPEPLDPNLANFTVVPDDPRATTVASPFVELYMSDLMQVETTVNDLNRSVGHDAGGGAKLVDRDAFDQEVHDRFAEIGFEVKTVWWYTNVPGVYNLDIEIQSRTRPDWDPDRMVHEVVGNLGGYLPDKGVIKTGEQPEHQHHKH